MHPPLRPVIKPTTHTYEIDVLHPDYKMLSMHVLSAPTQKQMATRLGVSQSLVSRALSGRAREIGASRETVEMIRRTAVKWNYQPSATALALLGAPTRTIGVVVKHFDDPYFGGLIGALQILACENGNSLLLSGGTQADLAGLQKHRVDGVILAGSDFQPEGLRSFAHGGLPVVQIGTGSSFSGTMQIHMDEGAGIEELVGYLASLGHRDIGFVAGRTGSNSRRGEIVRRRLRARGLSVRPKTFIFSEGSDGEVAEHAVDALLGLARMPTAMIAAEDSLAIALLRYLYKKGISVPREISIAGIDDIAVSAHATPPLTTLRQPIPEMAATAFRALTLSGGKRSPVSVLGTLIIRESCAPLASH